MTMTEYVYICSAGETFDSAAKEIWGREKYAAELMCANPEYCLMECFAGGEELEVPEISIPERTDSAAKEPEKAPWK